MSATVRPLPRYLLLALAAGLIVMALTWSFYQWRQQRMSANWMGPFLSAAQNLQPGKREFFFDLEDVIRFKELDDVVLEDAYRFGHSASPEVYIYDPIGYPYLIKVATVLFPFVGHQLAIIIFQCLIHLILCLSIIGQTSLTLRFRLLFLVLYALNPLVLRFVTFNHYYFWQAIPSFWLLFLAIRNKSRPGWGVLLLTLPFVLLARPTTVFVVLACLVAFYFYKSKKWGLIYGGVFLATVAVLYVPNQKNPWHTMYVGVGGYANPYGIALSDDDAYALYQQKTGLTLTVSTGGNYFDASVQAEYRAISRNAYLAIWQESPALLVKNALVYFFGGFSLGYINKAPHLLNYALAASGLLFFGLLLYRKKGYLVLAVVLTMAGFVLYYPPIQSYMYGSYLLLVWGFIEIFVPNPFVSVSNVPAK